MKKDCDILLLPSEKESFLGFNENKLYFSEFGASSNNWLNQNLHILSTDEISDGDWFIRLFDNTICKANSQSDHKQYNSKKIIASSDSRLNIDGVSKITPEYIEYYINEYNKGNIIKSVLIEYQLVTNIIREKDEISISGNKIRHKIKNNFIEITPTPTIVYIDDIDEDTKDELYEGFKKFLGNN